MEEIHIFKNSLERADEISLKIVEGLHNRNILKGEIEDVRDDEYYQKIDVDFLSVIGNKSLWEEVKTDFRDDTKNFFIETISYVGKTPTQNTIGCFLKTQAHIMIYHFAYSNMTYLLERDCIDWMIRPEFYLQFPEKTVFNEKKGRIIETKGRTIPRTWFRENIDKFGIHIYTDIVDEIWMDTNKELLRLKTNWWEDRQTKFKDFYRTDEYMKL